MSEQSDTPRTDAVIDRSENAESWEATAVQIAQLSAQLERELACFSEENNRILSELARVTAERAALLACADKFGDGIDWIQRAMQAEAERALLSDDLVRVRADRNALLILYEAGKRDAERYRLTREQSVSFEDEWHEDENGNVIRTVRSGEHLDAHVDEMQECDNG